MFEKSDAYDEGDDSGYDEYTADSARSAVDWREGDYEGEDDLADSWPRK